MKDKKTLITIIVLLVIILPMGIYGTIKNFSTGNIEVKDDNPNKEFIYNNKLYFYYDNELLATYECSTCNNASNEIDDVNYHTNYYKSDVMDVNSVINKYYGIFKENDNVVLFNLIKGSIVDTYESVKNYGVDATNEFGIVKKDNKYGVINIKGVILVPCKYDYIRGDGFSKDGSYKDGGYIIGNRTNKGYKYGYIDKNGKEIVKMEQEDIYRVTEIDSSDVYIVASQNGRYALFKNKENLTDYKYIDIEYNNKANVFTVQKNKTYGLIGIDGKVIIPEKYQELMVVGIFVKASLDGTEYNFDLNGNEVENSNFVSLESTSTGRFYISISKDNKYGIADKDKNVVVENKYDYIEEIENTGLLIATVGKDITIYSGSLKEIVSVSDAKLERMDNYIKVITSTEMYYLTSDGKKVDNKTVYLKNNLFASKSNDKWGFVDLKDNVKVPYEYDEVTEFNEFGFAGVHKDGKWGVINENGDIVLEPTYESDEISPVFIGKYCLKDGIVKDSI